MSNTSHSYPVDLNENNLPIVTEMFDAIIPFIIELSRLPTGKTSIVVQIPFGLKLDQEVLKQYLTDTDLHLYDPGNTSFFRYVRHGQLRGTIKDQDLADYLFKAVVLAHHEDKGLGNYLIKAVARSHGYKILLGQEKRS